METLVKHEDYKMCMAYTKNYKNLGFGNYNLEITIECKRLQSTTDVNAPFLRPCSELRYSFACAVQVSK